MERDVGLKCNIVSVLFSRSAFLFMFIFKPLEDRERESTASKSDENTTGSGRLRHFVCLYKKKMLFVAADSSYPPEISFPVTPSKKPMPLDECVYRGGS